MNSLHVITSLALSLSFSADALSQKQEKQARQEQVQNSRDMFEKWIETEKLIAKEKRDWRLGKELLNERVDLVKREIDSLRERIEEAEESITGAEKTHIELSEKNDKLEQASAELASMVTALEVRSMDLIKRLPDPIRDLIKPMSQRIPSDPEKAELSLSLRFQNVVGVLTNVNKFNREIHVTSEVRELGPDQTAEVTTVYVGIGQGYYVNAKGDLAGVGGPTAEGWAWQPANGSAAAIAKTIAILKNEEVAGFVSLPLRIQKD